MSVGGVVLGAVKIVVGAILAIVGIITQNPGLVKAGFTLVGSGILDVAGATIFKPKPPAEVEQSSRTYGFRPFTNESKGDAAIPVVYSNDTSATKPGHKIAPIYVSAATTPRGYEDYDFVKALKARGQSVSILMAVAEGPIVGIDDIRINDEPCFARQENVRPAESANGTRKTFTVPGNRIILDSIRVSVNGSDVGWTRSTRREVMKYGGVGDSTRAWMLSLQPYDGGMQLIDDTTEIVWLYGPDISDRRRIDDDHWFGVNAWMSEDRLTLFAAGSYPVEPGQFLACDLPVLRTTGVRFRMADDRKSVTLVFDSAPASGAIILVSFLRKAIPGVAIDWRNGARHQLPLAGHDAIRNDQAKGGEVTSTALTLTTTEECDDVVVNIASQSEFTAYDNKDGGRSPVNAQIKIEWKLSTEADSAYRRVRDPAEEVTGKTLYEFKLGGDSTSTIYWSLSIRQLLRRWCDDHPGDGTAKSELALWTRTKYTVRVTRTNAIQNQSSTYVRDRIDWLSVTRVLDERLSYPGAAMLSFHGIGNERLNGSLPNVTCKVRGLRDVEMHTGTAWAKSDGAQANRAWAAADLITAKRYGGGEQFTKAANLDTDSFADAAEWCDEIVTTTDGTEIRSRLDLILDTRQPLMEQVRTILAPASVVPVLDGNIWRLVIDRAVDLASVPVIYADGEEGSVLRATCAVSHPEVTARATELQVTYLDRDQDFQRREVWAAPESPADERRIERATAYGAARHTETRRYTEALYDRLTNPGLNASWAMTMGGLALESGDVVRLVSAALTLDIYVRIMRWELRSTDGGDLYITCGGAEYVPAAYGQERPASSAPVVTSPAAVAAPTGGGSSGAQVGVTIRRAA